MWCPEVKVLEDEDFLLPEVVYQTPSISKFLGGFEEGRDETTLVCIFPPSFNHKPTSSVYRLGQK